MRLLRLSFGFANRRLPSLAAYWSYRLWFRTTRFPETSREIRWRKEAREVTLRTTSRKVVGYIWGSGEPRVLLVHGWSSRGTRLGLFIAPLQSAGFGVMALDLPAHGRSAGRSTHLYEMAETLHAAAREHGPFHAAITHSFGAMVLAHALRQGLEIARTVCIAPPATLRFLFDHFAATLGLSPQVKTALARHFEARFGSGVWEDLAAVENARRLAVPALIIHDKDDRDVPWEHGRRLAEAWPGACFMATTGLGHRRILRDPRVVKAAVDFITTREADRHMVSRLSGRLE